jgi:hypothetical protein
MHHVHDDARILTEAMHYADPSVVEGLSILERDLTELEPKALEKSGRPAIDRPEPFTQTKPRDAETIASQVSDKRAVQTKCKFYVKYIRRNASAMASMLLAAR